MGSTTQIQELQGQYANVVSFGAQLLSEYQAINLVYGRLRDLGADVDATLVEQEKANNADWMAQNPWLTYYEPHLDRERFDLERPDRY